MGPGNDLALWSFSHAEALLAGSCLVTRAAGAELTVARSLLQPRGYLGRPLLPCGIVSPHPEQRGVLPQLIPEKRLVPFSSAFLSFPFMQPVLG